MNDETARRLAQTFIQFGLATNKTRAEELIETIEDEAAAGGMNDETEQTVRDALGELRLLLENSNEPAAPTCHPNCGPITLIDGLYHKHYDQLDGSCWHVNEGAPDGTPERD